MLGTWLFQEMKITVTVFAVDIFNNTIILIHRLISKKISFLLELRVKHGVQFF